MKTKKKNPVKRVTKPRKEIIVPVEQKQTALKQQTNDLLNDIQVKPEVKAEVKPEPANVNVKSADSLLDDMLQPKDKDDTANMWDDVDDPAKFADDDFDDTEKPKAPEVEKSKEGENNFERVKREIENADDIDDYDDPKIRKAECKLSAMIMVEAYVIVLSFTGQIISGYWDADHEKRYTLSPDRRNNLIRPLAKYFELQNKKRNPLGALIVAMIVSAITVVLAALSDRKQRLRIDELENKNKEGQEEIDRLRNDFEKQKIAFERQEWEYNNNLKNKSTSNQQQQTHYTPKKKRKDELVCTCGKPKGQKGRHKPTCQTVTGK